MRAWHAKARRLERAASALHEGTIRFGVVDCHATNGVERGVNRRFARERGGRDRIGRDHGEKNRSETTGAGNARICEVFS